MSRRHALTLIVMTGVGGLHGLDARAAEPPAYEVYAVRYARLPGFPVSFLVQGAEPGTEARPRHDFLGTERPQTGGRSWSMPGSIGRSSSRSSEGIADYTRPDKAVGRLGIRPEEVTDVIVTHMHSDHCRWCRSVPEGNGSGSRRTSSTTTPARSSRRPAKTANNELDDVSALVKLNTEGRVRLVDGDAREILPGVTVYTGGKHTFASQYVGVNTKSGRMVMASDNVYLYENLDKHVPIAQHASTPSQTWLRRTG